MRILIVEDDANECKKYTDIAKMKDNIEIVAVTNSSTEGLKHVKNFSPDAVILDLELTEGEGSGFDFIQGLKDQKPEKMPQIIVTTNIYSESVYNYLHKNKIDFIFYKNQANFSHENVLNTLLLLNECGGKITTANQVKLDFEDSEEDVISKRINEELDLIGVAMHLKGRKYLADAIYYVIKNADNGETIPVVQYLVSKYKRASSTISRAMQNAILHAWRISSIEDLTNLYTARINYETGVPTPTEFIYYYADKIKKMI